jgi:hypothetical protein
MKICLLPGAEAKRVEDHGFSPDCHLHEHMSQRDARQAAADGKVRFVSRRAVVPVGSVSLAGYWYDDAVNRNDRYLGIAQSGGVRTTQLVNFMPRGMKHKVRYVRACGAQGRLMPAKAVNAAVPATDCVGNQE